jgi:hypothetical protein
VAEHPVCGLSAGKDVWAGWFSLGGVPILPNFAKKIMLPNERFALECLQRYAESGDIVDATNGQFAHCPQPERYGDKGYYLTWEDHQHQGLLQSRDIGECCFFIGDAKKWLLECDLIPEGYFELWAIYEEFSSAHLRNAGCIGGKNSHIEKDENGKSKRAVEAGRRMGQLIHTEKDEFGRSIRGVRYAERLHSEKDEFGRSIQGVENAKRMNKIIHKEKDELGRSVTAMKTNTQVWESLIDGFRSTAGPVALHNRANGWDPAARVRIS